MNAYSILSNELGLRVASTQAPLLLELANVCESSISWVIGLLKHHEYWPLHCLRVPPVQIDKESTGCGLQLKFFIIIFVINLLNSFNFPKSEYADKGSMPSEQHIFQFSCHVTCKNCFMESLWKISRYMHLVWCTILHINKQALIFEKLKKELFLIKYFTISLPVKNVLPLSGRDNCPKILLPRI
jgi:hypothetical protein